jgi:hypothetical protein
VRLHRSTRNNDRPTEVSEYETQVETDEHQFSCVQNYWDFGLFPSPGILGTRKHGLLETGSVTVLRRGREDT